MNPTDEPYLTQMNPTLLAIAFIICQTGIDVLPRRDEAGCPDKAS